MIGKEHFKTKVTELGKAFSYSYTGPQQSALYDEIHGYSPYQFDQAVRWLINNKPPKYPPSNAEIMAAVREASNQDWAQKKEKERQEASEVFYGEKCEKTPHVQSAMRLVMGILSQTIERPAVVARMRELDGQYTGFEWNVAANKMETFYKRKGLI